MKRICFLLITTIVTISCSDDSSEPSKINKQLIDLDMTGVDYADFWLVATDKSGATLDYKQWKGENHLILNAEVYPDEQINILMVYKWVVASTIEQNLNIYAGIDPGRKWFCPTWMLESGPTTIDDDSQTTEGNFSVTWINAPASVNNLGSFIKGYGGAYNAFLNCNGTCTHEYTKYTSPEKVLFSHAGNVSTPMYFETDDVEAGGSYDIDYEDVFKPFENIFTIGVKGGFLSEIYFAGVENNTRTLQSGYWSTGGGQLKFGYNDDGHEKYVGYVSCQGENARYTFHVYKPSLTADDFQFPAEDFTVLDETFSNFSFSAQWERDFVYQTSRWGSFRQEGETTHWLTVNLKGESSGKQIVHKLPHEVIAAFPEFEDWHILPYQQSSLLFVDDGISYQEWLESRFSVSRTNVLRSYWWITK